MKNLTLGLCLLFSTSSVFAQDINLNKNEIGIDAIIFLSSLTGNFDRYDILELSYIRKMSETDLRIKFNFNKNDSNEDRTIASKFLDEENQFKFSSKFESSKNLLLSLGIAKRIKKGNFEYYVGIDAFSGVDIGFARSNIFDEILEANEQFVGELKSTNYNVGVTPVIGTKIPLYGRISLAIEFGVPIRFEMGSINYLDEATVQREIPIDRYQFGFDQLLNDLRISYSF